MPSIHVFSPVGGVGNRIDLELICPLLAEAGFDVTPHPIADRRRRVRYAKLARHVLSARRRHDINLFTGPLFPEWLRLARRNFWLPNPEGFHEHQRRFLPRIDRVLAKTRLTERAFGELGRPTTFVGFTSRDHFDPRVTRDATRFFHARSSSWKGTVSLLETWAAHPDWPELVTIISDPEVLPGFNAPNVRIIRRFVTDAELKELQNQFAFHICCSEAEGFGHYIMEPMSCGAIVLATNAPPMNELVQPGRGLLVECLPETKPMGLSHRYFFDPASLARQVQGAFQLDEETRRRMSQAARAFHVENDASFRHRFVEVMRELARGG